VPQRGVEGFEQLDQLARTYESSEFFSFPHGTPLRVILIIDSQLAGRSERKRV
jgi:hypothetical protein